MIMATLITGGTSSVGGDGGKSAGENLVPEAW